MQYALYIYKHKSIYIYLSLSLFIAISTGEIDLGPEASSAATQQMGKPKAL